MIRLEGPDFVRRGASPVLSGTSFEARASSLLRMRVMGSQTLERALRMMIVPGKKLSLGRKLWIGLLFLTMPIAALTLIRDDSHLP